VMKKKRYLAIKSKLDLALQKCAEEGENTDLDSLETWDDYERAVSLEDSQKPATVPPAPITPVPPKPEVDLYEMKTNADGLYYFPHKDDPRMPHADKQVISMMNNNSLYSSIRYYFNSGKDVNDKVARAMFRNYAYRSPRDLLKTTSQYWLNATPIYKEAIDNAIIRAARGPIAGVIFSLSIHMLKEIYEKHEELFNNKLKEVSEEDLEPIIFSNRRRLPMGFIWDEMIKGRYKSLKEILREKLSFESLEAWKVKGAKLYAIYPELVRPVVMGPDYFNNYSSILDVAEVMPEAKSAILNPEIKLAKMFRQDFYRFCEIYNEEERVSVYHSLLKREGEHSSSDFFHALQFSTDKELLSTVIKEFPKDILNELAKRSGAYLVGLGDVLIRISDAGGNLSPEVEKGLLIGHIEKHIEKYGLRNLNSASAEYLMEKYEIDSQIIKDHMFDHIYQIMSLPSESKLGKLVGNALEEIILSETAQRDDHSIGTILNYIDKLSKFISSKDEVIASLTTYAGAYYGKAEEYTDEEAQMFGVRGKAKLLAALSDSIENSEELGDEAISNYLDLANDLFASGYDSQKKIFSSRWNKRGFEIDERIMRKIEQVSILKKAKNLEGPLLEKYVDLYSQINSLSLFRKNKKGNSAHKSARAYIAHLKRLMGEVEWDKAVASEVKIEEAFLKGFTPSVSLIEEYPKYFETALENLNFQTLNVKEVVHVLLPKIFPEMLSGDLSPISDEVFSFINEKLLSTLTDAKLPYYMELYRSTRGFGRLRTWFDRDPDFLPKIIDKGVSQYPSTYLSNLLTDDFNPENKLYIRDAVGISRLNYLTTMEYTGTLESFVDFIFKDNFIFKDKDTETAYSLLKRLIQSDDYLDAFVEFIDRHDLAEDLKMDKPLLNRVMQFVQDKRGSALLNHSKHNMMLLGLVEASDLKYSAEWLREIEDLAEAKRIYPELQNDIEVKDLPLNVKVTESIYQKEQRSDHLASYFGPRYTISNNNTDPTKIMYAIGKDLVHEGEGIDHVNVGASGFTNSWALTSIGTLDPADMSSEIERKNLLEGRDPYGNHYVRPKMKDLNSPDGVKAIIIEQYQSDYPPLYSLIFNKEDKDHAPELRGTLADEYGEESFKDFAKHLDYINKAYPYLAIINTIEVAKKIHAPYIYIHDFEHVVSLANITSKDKARKLYTEIPSLIAEEQVLFYNGDKFWKIPASDSVIAKMRDEIKKKTGRGPEYDFSKSPRQNAEAMTAVRERARKDLRTRWNSAGENKSKLDEVKSKLQAQLETDMKEFDPEELAALSTPTEVLIYLGKIKKQYSKGEFKKKFGLINRSLGMLSRAFEAIFRMVKLSSILTLSKNDRALGVHNLWRKARCK